MMKLDQRHIQHLLLRCGFGDSHSVIRKYVNQPVDKIFTSLLEESKQPGVVSLEAARESSKDEGGSKEIIVSEIRHSHCLKRYNNLCQTVTLIIANRPEI